MSSDKTAGPAGVGGTEPRNEACEWCPDGHEDPRRRPWAVYVDRMNLDHDGQPTRLIVGKTGEQHCAESDAEWLRSVIRSAKADVREQLNRAERYAREMERQRNAFGEALTRAANGEASAVGAAADAMLALVPRDEL